VTTGEPPLSGHSAAVMDRDSAATTIVSARTRPWSNVNAGHGLVTGTNDRPFYPEYGRLSAAGVCPGT